jgi:predicted nucleic acid-binding Zn ribbon protein
MEGSAMSEKWIRGTCVVCGAQCSRKRWTCSDACLEKQRAENAEARRARTDSRGEFFNSLPRHAWTTLYSFPDSPNRYEGGDEAWRRWLAGVTRRSIDEGARYKAKTFLSALDAAMRERGWRYKDGSPPPPPLKRERCPTCGQALPGKKPKKDKP